MQRVEFVLGFSKRLFFFLSTIYLAAVIIVINLPWLIMFKLAGMTLLSWHFWQLVNLHVKRDAKKSVVYIWQDSAGRWGCLTHHKKVAKGELKGDSFKSAFFLILRFRFKTGTHNVIVPVDALNQLEYRQLCARLSI